MTKADGTKSGDRILFKTPVKKYTGLEIEYLRRTLNLTQRDFAAILGMSVRTVESWETNKNKPSDCAIRLLYLIDNDHSLVKKLGDIIPARRHSGR